MLAPTLNRRRDEWLSDLAPRLHELEQQVDGFEFERLAEKEAFVSMIVEATHSALKTHAAEKTDALRNAVLNVALGAAPGEDVQAIFLRLIDTLTPSHLRLLRFLQHPAAYIKGPLPEERILSK